MLCCFSHVQLFATLQTVTCQAPLSMGFSRQENWNELPFPPPGDFSNPQIKPVSLISPALTGGFFTMSAIFSSVQLLSHVQLFATPWTAALQASLSITNSQSLLRLMSIESVMPSNHFILRHPLLLLPSIFPALGSFQMSQFFT